jgi:hypothetical protein
MTTLREAAKEARTVMCNARDWIWLSDEELICGIDEQVKELQDTIAMLSDALGQPDHCPNCASLEAQNTELDRKLAGLELHGQKPVALMNTWISETEAVTEPLFKAPRRLTDGEIGEVWFAARIHGLTESDARRLIRAAEERVRNG